MQIIPWFGSRPKGLTQDCDPKPWYNLHNTTIQTMYGISVFTYDLAIKWFIWRLCILTWHRQTFVLREKKYSIERPKVDVTNFASFSEIVQKFVTWQTSLNFHYCQNGQSDRIELYSTEHEKIRHTGSLSKDPPPSPW